MRLRALLRSSLLLLPGAFCLTAACVFGCGAGNQAYNPTLVSGPASTPTPGFTLTAGPPVNSVTEGVSASYTLTVTSVNGFSASIAPGVTGLPDGATATFSPPNVTPIALGASTTLVISTTGVTPNTYALRISASGGSVLQQQNVQLVVTEPLPTLGGLNGNIE